MKPTKHVMTGTMKIEIRNLLSFIDMIFLSNRKSNHIENIMFSMDIFADYRNQGLL